MQPIGAANLGTFKVGHLHDAVQAARLKATGQPFASGLPVTPPRAPPTGWQQLRGAVAGGDVSARIAQFQGVRAGAARSGQAAASEAAPTRLHDRKIRAGVGENIQKLTAQILAPRLYQRAQGAVTDLKLDPREQGRVNFLVAQAMERKVQANPWMGELKLALRPGDRLTQQVTQAALAYAGTDPDRSIAENLSTALDQMFRPIHETTGQRLAAAVAEEKRDPSPKPPGFRSVDQAVLQDSVETFLHAIDEKLKGEPVDLVGTSSFTSIFEHKVEERCPEVQHRSVADLQETLKAQMESVNFYITRLA